MYKGQLLIKTTFSGSLEWPLYTDLTVFLRNNMDIIDTNCLDAYIVKYSRSTAGNRQVDIIKVFVINIFRTILGICSKTEEKP